MNRTLDHEPCARVTYAPVLATAMQNALDEHETESRPFTMALVLADHPLPLKVST